jgi:hypothetical protein
LARTLQLHHGIWAEAEARVDAALLAYTAVLSCREATSGRCTLPNQARDNIAAYLMEFDLWDATTTPRSPGTTRHQPPSFEVQAQHER